MEIPDITITIVEAGGFASINHNNLPNADDKSPAKQTKRGRPPVFNRAMTPAQRLRRWQARRRFEQFPWGDPGMIDEIFAWQWGLTPRGRGTGQRPAE